MILVAGATGKVGGALVAQLAAAGAPVRALVRDPARAALPDGVEAAVGDLTDAATLTPHLGGVDAMFLLWPIPTVESVDQLGVPLVDLLAERVRRVVYLSATAAADGPGGFWRAVERRIEASGLEWTFLRPSGFAGNTLIWAQQIRAGDVVRWPFPDAARSLIDERDIAAVAARALSGDDLVGSRPVLTGPQALTQAEQVRQIGQALGRPLRYQELSREAAREQLVAAFGDERFADSALDTWAGFVEHPEQVTSAVQEITGQRARTFRQWAIDHADAFR